MYERAPLKNLTKEGAIFSHFPGDIALCTTQPSSPVSQRFYDFKTCSDLIQFREKTSRQQAVMFKDREVKPTVNFCQ